MTITNALDKLELRGHIPLTFQEFLTKVTDDFHYELINGRQIITLTPSPKHQKLAHILSYLLLSYILPKNVDELFGELYLKFPNSDHQGVKPDLVFFSRTNTYTSHANYVEGIPSLAIEIVSPSSYNRDFNEKRELYAEFAIQEYWVADPDTNKMIEVFSLEGAQYISEKFYIHENQVLTSKLSELTDFKLNVQDLFRQAQLSSE